MAKYDKNKILSLLHESDTAPTSNQKGRKLEELVKYIFSEVDGVTHYASNLINNTGSQEIDVTFRNDIRQSPLYFLGNLIITECKNTAYPTGSRDINWFVDKVKTSLSTRGVLISLQGITGVASGEHYGHAQIRDALLARQVIILTINRIELLSLNYAEDLVEMLFIKDMKLALERTVV